MKHIEKALRKGYPLHGFRSSGGLRVLRMDKSDEDRFYAEAPNLRESLRILNDDIKASGREYSKVYGKKEPHYLTGAYASELDVLDEWVCKGLKFDIKFENDMFVIDMSTKEDIKIPQTILDEVYENKETIYWSIPDFHRVFESKYEPFHGGPSCLTGTIPRRSGLEANNEQLSIERISKHKDFKDALLLAESQTYKYETIDWYKTFKPSN
jgi:hypothetical protein